MLQLPDLISRLRRFIFDEGGSLKHKAIRSGFWLGSAAILNNLLTVIRSVAMARLLTPEIFGLMGVCLVITRGVETMTSPGFAAALIHRQDDIGQVKHTAFTLMVMRGFMLAAVVFLASSWMAEFYEHEVIEDMLAIMALSFIFSGFKNINTIQQQKELNFRRLAYLDQSVALISSVAAITAAWIMRDVWALVIGFLTTSLLTMLLSYVLIPGKVQFAFNLTHAKELFSYGKYITGTGIVLYAASELDNFAIGKVVGITELGYYVLAFSTANLVTTYISRTVSQIMFPAYSKLQNDPEALRSVYLRVFSILVTVTAPTALTIIALAPQLIELVYGERWLPAVDPLRVLCVFGVVRAVASASGYFLNGIGRPDSVFRISLARLILLAAIIYPVLIWFGLLGAAVAVTIAIAVQLLLGLRVINNITGLTVIDTVRAIRLQVLKAIALFVILAGGEYWLDVSNVWTLLGLLLAGGLFYVTVNYRYFNNIMAMRRSTG